MGAWSRQTESFTRRWRTGNAGGDSFGSRICRKRHEEVCRRTERRRGGLAAPLKTRPAHHSSACANVTLLIRRVAHLAQRAARDRPGRLRGRKTSHAVHLGPHPFHPQQKREGGGNAPLMDPFPLGAIQSLPTLSQPRKVDAILRKA